MSETLPAAFAKNGMAQGGTGRITNTAASETLAGTRDLPGRRNSRAPVQPKVNGDELEGPAFTEAGGFAGSRCICRRNGDRREGRLPELESGHFAFGRGASSQWHFFKDSALFPHGLASLRCRRTLPLRTCPISG